MENAVWITGANSGIGKSVAMKFIRSGVIVIGSARREVELKKMHNEEGVNEDNFVSIPMDVTDAGQIESLYNFLKEKYNIIGLVNNAGVSSFQPAIENKISDIKTIIDTNLLGSIYMIKTILPDLIERNEGRIINILSVVNNKIFPNSSVYSASKAGLEAYVKVLREELRGKNIRIINIYPGATKTPIWPNEALEKFSSQMMNPDKIAEVIFDAYNIQDNLVPEEIVLRPVGGDL